MNTPTKEQIEKVAEWWAVRTFDKAANQNNGDTSEHGGLSFMLMNLASMEAKAKAPSDSRDKFKQSLISQLTTDPSVYLDVDYHPSRALAEAAEFAGIKTSMIPIKTFTMYNVEDNTFRGRYQYGGPWETIS